MAGWGKRPDRQGQGSGPEQAGQKKRTEEKARCGNQPGVGERSTRAAPCVPRNMSQYGVFVVLVPVFVLSMSSCHAFTRTGQALTEHGRDTAYLVRRGWRDNRRITGGKGKMKGVNRKRVYS